MFLIVISCAVVAAICVVIAFELYKKFDRSWQLYMKFPGPKSSIFFGNVFQVPATTEEMFTADLVRAAKYPEIYRFPMLHVKVIMCFNADDIEYLISGHSTTVKPFVYDFLMSWMGTGLLTSTGEKWQTRRKILTPAFHFTILQGFLKVFNDETKHLIKILRKDCDADYLNVVPYISEFTLNSINDTAMGITPSEIGSGISYKKAIFRVGQILTQRLMRPWFYKDVLYKLSPSYWESEKLLDVMHNYTNTVIRKREDSFLSEKLHKKVDNKETTNGFDESYSRRKRLAMLDLLLSEKQNGTIDYEGIREEVDTFMFEGHDTVSMAICYVLLVLANHKSVQDEIRREIEEEVGDNEDPSYEDLNRLKYMEKCVKECLRLYPSVPYIFRETIKEGVSPSGRVIPEGTLVVIEIYNLHRDPKVFPDPEKFDPDRFLPENCNRRHPYAYIPFSAGPRNCIGQKYALLEIKAVLCGILRNFDLVPVHKREDIVIKVDLVLRPNDDGIRVKFVPRLK